MTSLQTSWNEQLAEDGFILLANVFDPPQVAEFLRHLNSVFLKDTTDSTLRNGDGTVYGARNLLQLWPGVAQAWRQPPLPDILREALGAGFGLARVLFFDKPPAQSWALPWHRDMTIAVVNNRLPSKQFSKPTFKIGVPHVTAPRWLLENMLTLRLHLDDMTEDNGPLKIIPGSHRQAQGRPPLPILGRRGDVLLMRPLLSHCSDKSREDTKQHRRILHFEFAGIEALPDGYAWHDFIRGERD
jgi:hypothetical protein